MSGPAFRFVHATRLLLDEPLAGIGPLSPEDRELVEDATFLAWDGVIETCLGAQVDFLLLTGDCFIPRSQSLRARVALEKGFEQLAAQGIAVYVAPGEQDGVAAWRKQFHLPPNVTLLHDENQEPVAIMRDHRVIATVFLVAGPHSDESRWSPGGPAALQRHQAPFRIGVVPAGTPIHWEQGQPVADTDSGTARTAASLVLAAIADRVDYLALGAGIPQTVHYSGGVAHDPGCTQSLNGEVLGPRGCTVVNVGDEGTVSVDPVAVAPIRWESISLELGRSHNWEDLVERMALTVMERTANDAELLWVIRWRLRGEGPVFESLAEPHAQRDLWELVEGELAGESDVRRVHRLVSVDHRIAAGPGRPAPTGLMSAFNEMLDQIGDRDWEQIRQELLSQDLVATKDWRPVKELLERVSVSRIVPAARELAGQWLE